MKTRAALLADLEAIHAKAVAEDRDLSDAEQSAYDRIKQEIEAMDKKQEQPDPSTLKVADAPAVVTKQRTYSVLKAIGYAIGDPNVPDPGIERELHQEFCRSRTFKGIGIPLSAILRKSSDGQSTLTSGAGGVLANTDRLLVDLLADTGTAIRKATILGPLGVSVVAVPSDQRVRVPIKTKPGQALWIPRDGSAEIDDLEFSDETVEPLSLAIGCKLNRSSLQYSQPAMESLVREDMSISITDAVNQGYLLGNGLSDAPVGLFKALTDASRDVTGALNASVTRKKFLDFTELIETYAEVGNSRRWLLHDNTYNVAQTTPAWSTAQVPIATGDGTLVGFPVVESHRCKTTDSSAHEFAIFGDFGQTFMFQFGAAWDFLPNPYHDSVYLSGGLLIRAIGDVNFLLRDVDRLVLASDVIA